MPTEGISRTCSPERRHVRQFLEVLSCGKRRVRWRPIRTYFHVSLTASLWKKLSLIELSIETASLDKFFVPAALHYAAVIDNQDLVRFSDGR